MLSATTLRAKKRHPLLAGPTNSGHLNVACDAALIKLGFSH